MDNPEITQVIQTYLQGKQQMTEQVKGNGEQQKPMAQPAQGAPSDLTIAKPNGAAQA